MVILSRLGSCFRIGESERSTGAKTRDAIVAQQILISPWHFICDHGICLEVVAGKRAGNHVGGNLCGALR